MLVVIDTNIIVSAFWSQNGAPARVMSMVLNNILVPCYDYRILKEYRDVLNRPKFPFSKSDINAFLDWIVSNGYSVVAAPIDIPFTDGDDKKFYEIAKHCNAKLITGNWMGLALPSAVG